MSLIDDLENLYKNYTSGWYIETVEQKSEFYTFKNPCKKYRDWNPFDYI